MAAACEVTTANRTSRTSYPHAKQRCHLPLSHTGCRICGDPNTVTSHLLPKAFAMKVRGDDNDVKIGSIGRPGYRLSKSGTWDRNLLCDEHERDLHQYDDYAINFCREFDARRIMLNDRMFILRNVDTDRLVRFAASVLWRHSVSNRPETAKIDLGPYEARLQAVSFASAPCSPEPALFIWANRSETVDVRRICMPPAQDRFSGLRFWSFIVDGLSFIMKTDQQLTPSSLTLLRVNGRSEIVSGYKPLDQSQEFGEIMKIVKNANRPRQGRNDSSGR